MIDISKNTRFNILDVSGKVLSTKVHWLIRICHNALILNITKEEKTKRKEMA